MSKPSTTKSSRVKHLEPPLEFPEFAKEVVLPTIDEASEEQGILESFFKLPRTEREIIHRLLEATGPGKAGVITLQIPFEIKERRQFVLPIYRLIRYHRLNFDSIVDGAVRSTYLPWIESITTIKAGKDEAFELRLNSNYEKIWSLLKESLAKVGVRLKSQYSTRLYQWAKPNLEVGFRRISLATLRKILGLEDILDDSGKVVAEAPLEAWASVKQRALDHALKEINKHSDIQLEVAFTGRGSYRKVNSLGFRITANKRFGRKEAA